MLTIVGIVTCLVMIFASPAAGVLLAVTLGVAVAPRIVGLR
jgi:hypothetical protein